MLLSLTGVQWLAGASYPIYEAGAVVPVTTEFEAVRDLCKKALGGVSADVAILLEWVKETDIDERRKQLSSFSRCGTMSRRASGGRRRIPVCIRRRVRSRTKWLWMLGVTT